MNLLHLHGQGVKTHCGVNEAPEEADRHESLFNEARDAEVFCAYTSVYVHI